MQPYSQDLRDRIITALEAGTATQRAIVECFCVSGSFVEKLWQWWRCSGSSAAKPHAGGGRQSALQDHLALLRTEVAKQPEATLAAWRDRIVAAQGRGSARRPSAVPYSACGSRSKKVAP